MFDIEFTTDEPELQDDGSLAVWGRTTLGDHCERFIAPVGHWQREDYEWHWLEAARRLVGESDRTGFFTAVYRFWWTAYRDGERVYVHEEFITPERYAGPYDGSVPYHIIEDRIPHTGDSDSISEWEVTMDDVREFIRRRETSAVS